MWKAIDQTYITGNVIFSGWGFANCSNVKITVQRERAYFLYGAHLYACQSNIGNVIDVQFNGSIISLQARIQA